MRRWLALSLILMATSALAYLDPGTGSYIVQILIAAVLGGLVAIKTFWSTIVLFFKRIFGKGGDVLKQVGSQARHALQELFEQKIFLRTWVKVSPDWSDNERALKQFGYDDE